MNKAEEATQSPPSYGEATQDQPPYMQQAPPYSGPTGQQPPPTYPPGQQQQQYNYPAGQFSQYVTTEYAVPGQPGYVYSNVVVAQPGQNMNASGPPPPDHMRAAIFVTLCCFWPTGIIAILKASEAKSALARGDNWGATTSAKSAKQMINISIIIGIITLVVLAVIIGLYVGLVLNHINRFDYDY